MDRNKIIDHSFYNYDIVNNDNINNNKHEIISDEASVNRGQEYDNDVKVS